MHTFEIMVPGTNDLRRRLIVAIAEDDDLQRDSLEAALQEAGFHVVALEDGFELADSFTTRVRRWADAVVADVNMPGRSGLDGLELARKNGLDLPIFVVSGDGRDEVRARVAPLGNALFIHLAAAIRELGAVHDLAQAGPPP